MYLASKDTEPLLCHCLACRVCKDAALGKNKPELSPGAGLEMGTEARNPDPRCRGVTLYVSLHEGVSS